MAEREPFRVEIIGPHPHRGKRGLCHPNAQMVAGGAMMRVTFDSPTETGADAAYALPSELRRLEPSNA